MDRLTKRDLDVVQLVTEGKTNREIADTLGISPHTVKTQLTLIFHKTGLYSRGRLIRRFTRDQLLDELIAVAPVGVSDLEARKDER
jgi:DNA-binding CsgD family transcriptional regulator